MRHRPRELRRCEARRHTRGLRDPAGRADPRVAIAFLVYLELGLFFPEGSDLKGKRKEVQSVKAQLSRRFGASVAETDHHDLWQRATLSCALVARDASGAQAQADALERWLSGRFPEGYSVRRALASGDELMGDDS